MATAIRSLAGGAALLMAATASQASLMLDTDDCDGVVGFSDSVSNVCYLSSDTTYAIDVLYTTAGGDTMGGTPELWRFTLIANDMAEINVDGDWYFSFASGISGLTKEFEVSGNAAIGVGYDLLDDLSDGSVIGTLTFTTGTIGTTPDDDVFDLKLAGNRGLTIYDPAHETILVRSGTDLQAAAVPLPVPALLLMGGVGALAGLRRRSRRT
ncbi:VPLPA-CTERM sorting domain-containing protein [Poseidonocella sp. HB161398]|uniref:VPLPA-CTERM sorting domain-containing protein n=1 Tax=Poseidonocella sp. HB161398 TaxID=2320855 RepID=UPI0011095796|nr:VPLPA-CTERM sorting domain-containing protein [Poseidonocella sp. HB161398]